MCVNGRGDLPIVPRKGMADDMKLGVDISRRLGKRWILEFAEITRKSKSANTVAEWGQEKL